MGNIVLLDDLTINKIAAGEVIERPASVVKELVENSIDAGATVINVEIKNGGISYIRVSDNGKGFWPDDMEIAFERHATSKIRQATDLEIVKTMGFRGEALASIAAISKVELVSRREECDIGYKICVEGGNITNKIEAGCPKGSTITITDLFFNTPVRYKFLKKDFTEAGYIEDAITRIALANPQIAIKLINTGKTVIQTPGNGDRKAVIYSIFGKDIAENILEVDYQYDDIKVTGVVGKPIISRSNRANQIFFVNKRYVKDKALTSAAEQAFKGMITIGKYGFVILNLDMNPQKVDVNVHPAKLEVRFEEENKVFKAVYHAIKETLLKSDLVGNPDRTDELREETEQTKLNNSFGLNNVNVQNEKPKFVFGHSNFENKFSSKEENKTLENPDTPKADTKDTKTNFDALDNNFLAQIYAERQSLKSKENNINNQTNENSDKEEKANTENENNSNSKYNFNDDTAVITSMGNIKNLDDMETKSIDTNEVNQKFLESIKKLVDLPETMAKDEKLPEIEKKLSFDEMYERTFGRKIEEAQAERLKEEQEEYRSSLGEVATGISPLSKTENISVFKDLEKNATPLYKFIGIAFSTYIIIQMKEDMYIIDQHAAHERIMYEKVKANYYNDKEKDSQLMLLPDIITLSHKEMDIAKENMEMFRKAGFTLEEFGENTIKLTGVPDMCLDLDTKELFLETLDEINTVARTAKQEKEEKFIATVACKAAVKAYMALTKEEVDKLMAQLLVLPNPFTCPHGRPTAIKMSKTDIEKKFSRR